MPSQKKQSLQEITEDELIARITKGLPQSQKVRVGVGDDCAVVEGVGRNRWQLLKTDGVVEGVHFRPEEDWKRVGWKALCRNISDIAAMGGVPEHALVTLAVAPSVEVSRVEALYAGIKKAAKKFGVSIVGGETSRSHGPLFLSVALTGSVERSRLVLRSGGRAGDTIFVTGRLGGSFASGKHLDFVPRLEEARWLTEKFRIHSMMDLSDGLGSDLPRLAKASGCSYEIDLARIPANKGCSVNQAIGDGEDFELLFTVSSRDASRIQSAWKKRFPRLPLTTIGQLIERGTNSHDSSLQIRGFDHFALSR